MQEFSALLIAKGGETGDVGSEKHAKNLQVNMEERCFQIFSSPYTGMKT
jgi:hypothetical protein